MLIQYQIQAARSSLTELQSQVENLSIIVAKEYDAPWLKNAETVVRDSSGKFAKKAGSVAKSVEGEVVSRYGADAERITEKAKDIAQKTKTAAKNAGAEAVSKYGADAERAVNKVGEIKDSIASHASKVSADIQSSAKLLADSFNQKLEQAKKLSADTKNKLSAILSSPAVTDRMKAVSTAMADIGAEAKKGYDSAVANIMKTKGNIEAQIKTASDSASKLAASAKNKAKSAGDAMQDMGAYAANQLFYSYIGAIMSAKNLAGIIAQGDSNILQKLYSLPLPDGQSAKDAIAPLLDKMKKWSNTAPKALQDKYADTIKSIDAGFQQSFDLGKSGDFGNQATNA